MSKLNEIIAFFTSKIILTDSLRASKVNELCFQTRLKPIVIGISETSSFNQDLYTCKP